MKSLSPQRVRRLLKSAKNVRILVVGDLMLDQFTWGRVQRISPEAPVPIVEFDHETFMPGGAANVARNLSSLGVRAEVFGVVGRDDAAMNLRKLLREQNVDCRGIITVSDRETTVKTRIIAHQQQVVRVDRESRQTISPAATQRLVRAIEKRLDSTDAVIVADYAKGVVTQELLTRLKPVCRTRGLWLSVDPKTNPRLNLEGVSLLTPNRKETFELAGVADEAKADNPLEDKLLMAAARKLFHDLHPALLLVTLGELGLLLCRRKQPPVHIPTTVQEVFDVSGAGDTTIAAFTLAIACGASPVEAAVMANHAAGIVVGKIGAAAVTPEELLAGFKSRS